MSSYETWLAARGYRRVTVQRSSFGECDSDGSRNGRDAQRLDAKHDSAGRRHRPAGVA